jgi:polyferredoxin/formate hydrogenlyase subunit 6/NADH:ubiquinone oxidoreductase subunit I
MLRRARIVVQIAFLTLFLYLLIRTVGMGDDRLGPPVRAFLDFDPLIALTTWLRTHALPGAMALAFVTIALTLLLGRFICGWVCPLGTLSQASLRIARSRRKERSRDGYRASQRWKFLILVFVLASAASGALWTGILDPISLTIRSLAVGLGPATEGMVRGAASALAGSRRIAPLSDPAYGWIRDHALAPRPPRFEQGFLLAAIFTGLLALSWWRRRFWCRVLCPLGGLLGLTAHAGCLTLRQKESVCRDCAVCTFHCQGAADPDVMGGWRPAECYVCGNCTSSCRQSGLAFGFAPPRFARAAVRMLRRKGGRAIDAARGADGPSLAASTTSSMDLPRRRLLLALGLGLAAGPVARISPTRARPSGGSIRPPGAGTESEFLDRCVRCGECMKVCVGNGLHPAGMEDGLSGLWTPVLRARIGYCEYGCTLCGQVCPTGAIRRLEREEKEKTVIGLAWVDPGRCLPYAYATPCIVCEEHCPTSPKAIVLQDATVIAPSGEARGVRRPTIDPHRCVGCGICEYRCPLDGSAAIQIFATGRTGEGSVFDFG